MDGDVGDAKIDVGDFDCQNSYKAGIRGADIYKLAE